MRHGFLIALLLALDPVTASAGSAIDLEETTIADGYLDVEVVDLPTEVVPMNPLDLVRSLFTSSAENAAKLVDTDVSFEPFEGPLERIPRNRTEVYQVYGNPGVGEVDKRWARANMVTAEYLPGRWSKSGRLYVHRLAEPYLREALRRARAAQCLDEIGQLGCYSFRHQRHDTARPLSYHSWGIAIDINSGQNAGRDFERGKAPEPFSALWRRYWPDGITAELVRCFETVGWSWGGRWQTYPDPMHFELVA